MALVHRNGRAYYYKSSREGGRVVCRYQGAGTNAVLMALLDAGEREDREAEARDARAERDALEAAERPLVDYFNLVDDIARAALLASGCHQHKREWRRRRERHEDT